MDSRLLTSSDSCEVPLGSSQGSVAVLGMTHESEALVSFPSSGAGHFMSLPQHSSIIDGWINLFPSLAVLLLDNGIFQQSSVA